MPTRHALALSVAAGLFLSPGCSSAPAEPAQPALGSDSSGQSHNDEVLGISRDPLYDRFAERGARAFRIRYQTTLEGLAPGAQVRLWIPLPRDDAFQHVTDLEVQAPWIHRETEAAPERNRILYLEGIAATSSAEVGVSYTVQRLERRAELGAPPGAAQALSLEDVNRYLQPSALVTLSAEISAAHASVQPHGEAPLARARAFYEHVRTHMSYDKRGVGWGRGDSRYACTVGRGNCTDFHAFFQALCLVEGIPTRFAIGLYGPYADQQKGEEQKVDEPLGGYHCWAEFYVDGPGWVPVDISEASKLARTDPERVDYFFGSHSDNRVTLSRGRDLVLEPPQAGPALNFFVEPYAEVEGRPFAGARKQAFWTDLPLVRPLADGDEGERSEDSR